MTTTPSSVAACSACLATDDLRLMGSGFKKKFEELTGLPSCARSLFVCAICRAQLAKWSQYRDKCVRARHLLDTLTEDGSITDLKISSIDRRQHKLTLNLTRSAVYTFNSKGNQHPFVKCENDEDVDAPDDSLHFKREDTHRDDSNDAIESTRGNKVDGSCKTELSTNSNTGFTEDLNFKCKREIISIDIYPDLDYGKVDTFVESPPFMQVDTGLNDSKDDLVNSKQIEVEVSFETTSTGSGINNNTGNIEVLSSKRKRKRVGGKLENTKENKVKVSSETTSTTSTNTGNTKVLHTKRKRKKIGGKLENLKENKVEGSSETTTKSTNINTGNTKGLSSRCKRKRIGDDFYPDFDYEKFEKEFNVKIKFLNKEEQRQEVEDRKSSKKYLGFPFKCENCGKGFNHEKTHRNHMWFHDPSVGTFECDICHVRFRTNRKRLAHGDLHRLKFTCNTCGVSTRDRDSTRRHHAQHGGAKFPCQHCQAVFGRSTSFFSHMRAQHPAAESVSCCQVCGEAFNSPRGVLQHQARAHRPQMKPEEFKCPTCDVNFSSSEALARHTVSGAAHSAWPCAECGEGCDSEEALKAHMESHKDHRCEQCDVSFTSSSALTTHHARAHLNVRPPPPPPPSPAPPPPPPPPPRPLAAGGAADVVCETCGQQLPSETALRRHQRSHQAGAKPFACQLCHKTFTAKRSRDWHIRTHTGERPFHCDQCPRTFSVRSNLRRHRRVMHEGIRALVPCALCGALLSSRSAARLHVDTVHRRLPAKRRNRKREKIP